MYRIKSLFFSIRSLGVATWLFSLFFAFEAHAVPSTFPGADINSVDDFVTNVLCVLAQWMFWILIILSTVFVIVAAYKYLISEGKPDKVSESHRVLTYAAVSIFVALLAKGFPVIVADIVSTGTNQVSAADVCQ